MNKLINLIYRLIKVNLILLAASLRFPSFLKLSTYLEVLWFILTQSNQYPVY